MPTNTQKLKSGDSAHASEPSLKERRQVAASIRDQTRDDAFQSFSTSPPQDNGDQALFERTGLTGFASFTKTLAHDASGFVDIESYQSLLEAIQVGSQAAFETVQLGGGDRLLANPLNAYSHQLIGDDSNGARMAPAPNFSSRNTAVDMVERYWMALCRDVRFEQYESSPLIAAACEDLNKLNFEQEFGFVCTPQTIFRAPYSGAQVGPHVSQFLLQNFLFGNQPIVQQQVYPREGLDYLTDIGSWLSVNNGDVDPTGSDDLVGTRFISSLRDAGQWVHVDFPFQSGLNATINLLGQNAAITSASPYANGAISTSGPFGSLGGPDIAIHAGLAAVYGLKHAWFQKWCVHRRLRPEVYAQRLELFFRGTLGSGGNRVFEDAKFNEVFGEGAEVWRTTRVLDRIFKHNRTQNIAQKRGNREGTWLLPIAYPEGSPAHPAYPGGHATFIAAAATVAKAFFADGDLSGAVVPSASGESLVRFDGPPLTVHGELNKLISNITLFRDGAGMHWRTDGTAAGPQANTGSAAPGLVTGGNALGEKMAISMLRDLHRTYREEVGAFEFRALDGRLQSIRGE